MTGHNSFGSLTVLLLLLLLVVSPAGLLVLLEPSV
jgi:hypothetical protein